MIYNLNVGNHRSCRVYQRPFKNRSYHKQINDLTLKRYSIFVLRLNQKLLFVVRTLAMIIRWTISNTCIWLNSNANFNRPPIYHDGFVLKVGSYSHSRIFMKFCFSSLMSLFELRAKRGQWWVCNHAQFLSFFFNSTQ